MVEWFAQYDRHFQIKGNETGQQDAAFIWRVLGLRRGLAVLDAPCGAGRIAIHLARRGCRLTGLDLTHRYLVRARKRFADEGLTGTFTECDMRNMEAVEEFDAVYNWQGSFGYFRDRENMDVLARFARALRRGGRLLIDQPNREWILRHFRSGGQHGTVTSRTRWEQHSQRAITISTDSATGQRWSMSIRLYTPIQLERSLSHTGLEVEAMYGGSDGSSYRRDSRRIIIVARKP